MGLLKRRHLRKLCRRQYLTSPDFNGLPVRDVLDPNKESTRSFLRSAVAKGELRVALSELSTNPHIIRLDLPDTQATLKALESANLHDAVLYPVPEDLAEHVDRSEYSGNPYGLELALGEPQLSLCFFDLDVLERYRNDPRYVYRNDDIRGSISIRDAHVDDDAVLDRDKTFLQSFGIAYGPEDERLPVICVFRRYLADLSAEHQQVWKSRELAETCLVHPDYYRNSICGEFGEFVSLYDALLLEIQTINFMCDAIGWPPLFRSAFEAGRPRHFGMLLRPTAREYAEFVQTLDKILSDNINHKFFRGRVDLEAETERADGKVVAQRKGTIALLRDWIEKHFRTDDPEPIERAIQTLREIRALRGRPAHRITEDVFDRRLLLEQRKLLARAYGAVRLIRLVLANHPGAHAVEIPELVRTGERLWPL